MAKFRNMVSMKRTPEEKADARVENMYPPPIADMPDVPPGLCLCLTETELEKLSLSDECEVGDTIHLVALAEVTSISKTDTGAGCKCRIELAIVSLSCEDESDEADD
jgi:hypothetical protein